MVNYKFVSINPESNLNDERIPKQVEKEMGSKNKNFSILQPLMKNYHVLRHPAIQKEVEERAAAEARLLSDDSCNTLEKCRNIDNKDGEANKDRIPALSDKNPSDIVSEFDQTDKNVIDIDDLTKNIPAPSTDEKIGGTTSEDLTKPPSNYSLNHSPNEMNSNYKSSNRYLPTGSIEVRKCYLPENMRANESTTNENILKINEVDSCHMKCFRTQPGKTGAEKLEKQEKLRKLATLAVFGHTFRRSETAGVRPHAVAVNGFRKYHLTYSSPKSISKKNRKSKFPRICLTGKTAAELLARSCTESSDDSDDEYCSNNNTQKLIQRVPKVNSPNVTSKSLISSMSKSKKASPKKEQNDDDEFQCHYCDRSFTTKSGLGWHESYAHPRDCRVCSKSFQFSNRWSRHKDPICNPCSEKYPQPKNSPIKLTPTLSQNYNPNQLTEKQKLYYRFKCDICNKLFGKRSRMINHITNAHPSEMHKVDLAKFVFSPKKVNSFGGRCHTGGYGNTARKCTPAGRMEQ